MQNKMFEYWIKAPLHAYNSYHTLTNHMFSIHSLCFSESCCVAQPSVTRWLLVTRNINCKGYKMLTLFLLGTRIIKHILFKLVKLRVNLNWLENKLTTKIIKGGRQKARPDVSGLILHHGQLQFTSKYVPRTSCLPSSPLNLFTQFLPNMFHWSFLFHLRNLGTNWRHYLDILGKFSCDKNKSEKGKILNMIFLISYWNPVLSFLVLFHSNRTSQPITVCSGFDGWLTSLLHPILDIFPRNN